MFLSGTHVSNLLLERSLANNEKNLTHPSIYFLEDPNNRSLFAMTGVTHSERNEHV